MIEESEIQNLKNRYPEFFNQFSPELLDFVFSEKISTDIAEICLENKVEDEEVIEKISYRIALVLLNQVPKENLAKIFEKGAGLNPIIAEKISFDVEKRIFSQAPGFKSVKTSLGEPETILSPENQTETEFQIKEKDTYREPIE